MAAAFKNFQSGIRQVLCGGMGSFDREDPIVLAPYDQHRLDNPGQIIPDRSQDFFPASLKIHDLTQKAQEEFARCEAAAGDVVKAKDLEIEANKQEIAQLEAQIKTIKEQSVSNEVLAEKDAKINDLATQLQSAISQEDYQAVQAENTNLKNEINGLSMQIEELKTKVASAVEARSVMAPSASMPRAAPSAPAPAMAAGPIDTSGARVVCPNCGSSKLREEIDKTRIISYIPKIIYGKKHICTKCTFEF